MTSTKSPATLAWWKFVASLALTALMVTCLSPASAQNAPTSAQNAPASAENALTSAQNPPAAPVLSPEATSGPPLFEHWKINLDAGARTFDLSGDQPGMFLEHRDITRGFFVNDAGLHFVSAKSPFSFRFNASDVRELDETIAASLSKAGKFRTTFLWDRLPRYYSTGTSLFHAAAPGILIVSPAIRAGFQALVDGQPAPAVVGGPLPPFARAELAAGTVSALRVKRDQAGLRQTARFGRLELHVQAKTDFRRGNRPKGTGTFARLVNANVNFGDGRWESLGTELPEPVEYRTTDFKAGAVVSGAKWRFGIDYRFTLFRNNVGTLTYQNPFRVTDNVGVTATGAPSPGSAIGRNRFVTQQLSLPPDTDYHSATAWWGFDLPRKTQFRGLASWGLSSQNDPFLPYSQNAALNGTGLGFANNIPSGTSVTSVAALSQRSLNGEVRNINVDSTLVSKLWKNMVFRLQYRDEDMKNKSTSILFPGFSRFGESHWVTAIDYYNIPIRNLPVSFTRQDGIASWEWDIASWVTWNGEYQYESWKRTNRNVPHSGENSFLGRLDFKLPRKIKFEADFTYSYRVPDFYKTVPMVFNPNLNSTLVNDPRGPFGPGWEIPATAGCTAASASCTAAVVFDPTVSLEFSQLRRFDQAVRKRYDGRAALDIPFGEKVKFSASYRYLRDNYGKGFYGLQFDDQASVDGELTFSVGERAFLYTDYSRQFDSYRDLGLGALICGPSCTSGAPPNVSACCAIYPIANTWDRISRSTLDTAQAGFNWAPSGEKTTIDMSYGYSFAKDRIHTSNPFPILLISPLTAGTYNYPDTRNRFHEVLVSVTRKIRPGLDLGVQYRFESYLLDDFFLNNLQPYSQGLFAPGGLTAFLPRQTFLNARFTTYHAHEESFFVR